MAMLAPAAHSGGARAITRSISLRRRLAKIRATAAASTQQPLPSSTRPRPVWRSGSPLNLQGLIAECGGPLTALVRLCREAEIPFFPRIRMNSHYVIDPSHPGYGRFRREQPHLLIGRLGEEFPEKSVEWGIRTGLDYAHPEVREHIRRIACEVFEHFDVDGVELDFMRHSAFFRMAEARPTAT